MAYGTTTQPEWNELERERLTLAFGCTRVTGRADTARTLERMQHLARLSFAGLAVGAVYGAAQLCGVLAGMR
jgi:hypothetical protein